MAEAYRELVVEGPLLLIRGYLAGVLVGRGADPHAVLFANEHHIAREGLIEELAEWMHLVQNVSHLVVPVSAHPAVQDGLARAPTSFGIVVRSDRAIRSSSFRFSYTAYNPRLAQQFDSLLRSHPEVRLSDDYQPAEVADPNAAGVEVYSPAHDYEVHAQGTAAGPLSAIVDLHRRCREHSLLRVEEIELELE